MKGWPRSIRFRLEAGPDPAFPPHSDGAPGEGQLPFDTTLEEPILSSAHLPLDGEGGPDDGPFLGLPPGMLPGNTWNPGFSERDRGFRRIVFPHVVLRTAKNCAILEGVPVALSRVHVLLGHIVGGLVRGHPHGA